MLQRSEVSNPLAYGAKIVATILEHDSLREMWFEDFLNMSSCIQSMRQALYEHLIEYDHYHIYMAANSRISIAGLNPGNIRYVAESIAKCLRSSTL
ncbi:unnamed protein product [Penicillium discolor]